MIEFRGAIQDKTLRVLFLFDLKRSFKSGKDRNHVSTWRKPKYFIQSTC